MKGKYAFCPRSGAPLSEERHYDDTGRAQRVPVPGSVASETRPDGELTNGALRSARTALFNHFRESYRRHHEADDDRLFTKTALALTRLKRAATEQTEWDMYVWYALGERLSRAGYDVAWMNAHVEPRCPDCAGPLKYRQLVDTVSGRCATNCTGDNADALARIRTTVCDLAEGAFDAPRPDEDDLTLL